MGRGAWRATVLGVAESYTTERLNNNCVPGTVWAPGIHQRTWQTERLALKELCMPGMCWEQRRGLWYEPREGEQMLRSDREVKVAQWKCESWSDREVKVWKSLRLFVIPWTVACQAPLSIEFSRQEYWSGLPFPPPGIFLTQGLNPNLLHRQEPTEPPGKSPT